MDRQEQQFDEVIKRKLSEGSVDFDTQAWEKMERKLDSAGRKRLGWWIPAAAAVLLLSALCIWAYRYWKSEEPVKLADAIRKEAPADTAAGEGKLPAAGGDLAKAASQHAKSKGELGLAGETPAEGGTRRSRLVADHDSAADDDLAAAGPVTNLPSLLQEADLLAGLSSTEVQLSADRIRPKSGLEPVKPSSRLVEEPDYSLPAKQKSPLSFSLGLLAAPDLNAVGSLQGGKAGFNVGLDLGLAFNERLSLHSGLIYAKKPYNAAPGDYHSDYLPQGLANIAAVCEVIDIPLNLRYTLYQKGANKISVNMGLSSYLMLREDYTYEYQYGDPRVYEYRNENQHFMGVGNAGLLLERKIGNDMSIGLQPFVKVPLTGIGQGEVKLISAGAAVSLNLDLSRKQK